MLALLRANPDAFIRGNINLLKAGAVLRMPDATEISQLSAGEAAVVVQDQIVQWRALRQPALLPAAVYLATNFVQSNLVSPLVLGNRLTLNPVAIFIGLVFWLWIWGVPGAFIAVPLLATFKIFCDHIESLAPIGEFLGK